MWTGILEIKQILEYLQASLILVHHFISDDGLLCKHDDDFYRKDVSDFTNITNC